MQQFGDLIDQAAEQFGIKDIVSLAAAIDNQGLLSKPFQAKGASKGTFSCIEIWFRINAMANA
ncbi:hypothetical protein [Myroides odoratus]|uniref:hypothetical protein n=1 Tax=Myroides odoratus TaxID=256 RepID=UPI003342C1AC